MIVMKVRAKIFVLSVLAALVLFNPGVYGSLNAVDCYAVLVVAGNDTNVKVHSNLDPIDRNGAEIALARVYGALKDAGYRDANMRIHYFDGRLEPDWSEKEQSGFLAELKKHHFEKGRRSATGTDIRTSVAEIKKSLDDNDKFVFYIITHGAANGYIQLAHRGHIGPSEIETLFSGMKSKTNYILFDSCYSGRILDDTDIPNAVVLSATSSRTPGWVDRKFSNCAYFLECKNDRKLDDNKDGFVDYEEAFKEVKEAAASYEVKLKKYLRSDYRPPRPMPRRVLESASIIPTMEANEGFEKASLGAEKKKRETPSQKKKEENKRKKTDRGERLVKQALNLENEGRIVEALELYEKAAELKDKSEFSARAAARMKKLLSNEKTARAWEEAKLEKQLGDDLRMAESYLLSGAYEKAREYCEKVIKAAPESSQAKKARELLRTIEENE